MGESITPMLSQPSRSRNSRTRLTARMRSSSPRTIPPFANRLAPRLKLRLDQCHKPSTWGGTFQRGRQRQCQTDEADIGDNGSDGLRDEGRVELARVRRFQRHIALVSPQTLMELRAADIDRVDLRGAFRQQHFGEPTGRGADIERNGIMRRQTKRTQRGKKFERTP